MTTPYDVDHFIRKFEAIDENLWTTENYVDPDDRRCMCALGHCGARSSAMTEESRALYFMVSSDLTRINDGHNPNYPQPTPKQRVLAALRDIKDREK